MYIGTLCIYELIYIIYIYTYIYIYIYIYVCVCGFLDWNSLVLNSLHVCLLIPMIYLYFLIFYIYIYIYIYIRGSLKKFPDFFLMGFFIDSTHMKL